jgi:hypothetical protein
MNCQQVVFGSILNREKSAMRESHVSEEVNMRSFGKSASGTSI